MAGRAGDYDEAAGRWSNLVYMPCVAENGFSPAIPSQPVDLIYLCFPNNPTGAVATREQLKAWVDYANRTGAVILYDSAYEAFITDPAIPHSIFEIEGARTCAIEFRSFSKTAGFTGTPLRLYRYPKDLVRGGVSLNGMWNRRQCTKFNGVPYVVQKGAAAVYNPRGQGAGQGDHRLLSEECPGDPDGLAGAGLTVCGGENSPYIWARTPDGMGSWAFFDKLLQQATWSPPPARASAPAGGVHPSDRLRRGGGHRGGGGADPGDSVNQRRGVQLFGLDARLVLAFFPPGGYDKRDPYAVLSAAATFENGDDP